MALHKLKNNKDAANLLSFILDYHNHYPERFIHPLMGKEFGEHREKITEGLTHIENYLKEENS